MTSGAVLSLKRSKKLQMWTLLALKETTANRRANSESPTAQTTRSMSQTWTTATRTMVHNKAFRIYMVRLTQTLSLRTRLGPSSAACASSPLPSYFSFRTRSTAKARSCFCSKHPAGSPSAKASRKRSNLPRPCLSPFSPLLPTHKSINMPSLLLAPIPRLLS